MATLEQIHEALEQEAAEQLRARGWLVLSPSDTSPAAELVRAAFRFEAAPMAGNAELEAADLLHTRAYAVTRDPAVRAWVERGRR